ncbi:MAG: hypothetical protein HJJLKODD_01846 [Phycisphaerae bacterium]|nr:hypothetical protein [Phycisphaerae bacterium]
MIRRTTASLGLLGFAIAIFAGLFNGHSYEVIITRALSAMAILAGVGMVVGYCADHVVREYRTKQYLEIFGHPETPENSVNVSSENSSTPTPS